MTKLSKSYLRYDAGGHFGVVTSTQCNTLLSGCGRFLLTGANESIVLWSLKKSEAILSFDPNGSTRLLSGASGTSSVIAMKAMRNTESGVVIGGVENNSIQTSVTFLSWLEIGHYLAAGYADGNIIIWELDIGSITTDASTNLLRMTIQRGYHIFDVNKPPNIKVKFHGHKSMITSFATPSNAFATPSNAFATPLLLASGSSDTDIVIWDTLAETGKYRLRGHRDRITGLAFLNENVLVSCSKDKTVKLWTIENQVCYQTIVDRAEFWSLCYLNLDSDTSREGRKRLICGSTDHLLRVYDVNSSNNTVNKSDVNKTVNKTVNKSDDKTVKITYSDPVLELMGTLQREITNVSCLGLQYGLASCQGQEEKSQVLVCMGNGKALETFRIHSIDESKRKMKRRKKTCT